VLAVFVVFVSKNLRCSLEGLHKYCIVHQVKQEWLPYVKTVARTVAAALASEARRDGRFAAAGTCGACQKLSFATAAARIYI